jgi:K+-transporting ATPase ATPase C chain
MPSLTRSWLGQLAAGVRTLLVLTVLLGLAYPLAMTAFAQIAFSARADGSFVDHGGQVVGSRLVGQTFTTPKVEDGEPVVDAKGQPVLVPDPAYFQPRPSASDYDPLATGASNLGPENPELIKLIEERRQAIGAFDGIAPSDVAPNALMASGSGLDPQISPAYAEEQIPRVAKARGMSEREVRALVEQYTDGRILGFLGEPTVNVLMLNLALDDASS